MTIGCWTWTRNFGTLYVGVVNYIYNFCRPFKQQQVVCRHFLWPFILYGIQWTWFRLLHRGAFCNGEPNIKPTLHFLFNIIWAFCNRENDYLSRKIFHSSAKFRRPRYVHFKRNGLHSHWGSICINLRKERRKKRSNQFCHHKQDSDKLSRNVFTQYQVRS